MSAKNGHEITFSTNFKSYFSLTSTNYEQDLNIHFGRRFFSRFQSEDYFYNTWLASKQKVLIHCDTHTRSSLIFLMSNVKASKQLFSVWKIGIRLDWTFVFIATYFIYNTKYFTQLKLLRNALQHYQGSYSILRFCSKQPSVFARFHSLILLNHFRAPQVVNQDRLLRYFLRWQKVLKLLLDVVHVFIYLTDHPSSSCDVTAIRRRQSQIYDSTYFP